MKIVRRDPDFRETLERNAKELEEWFRRPADIAIESRSDHLDEIPSAPERHWPAGGTDREARLLRQVRIALVRLREGSFGAMY